jgi:YHS domain-containing protein
MKKLNFLAAGIILFAASCGVKTSTGEEKTEDTPATSVTVTQEKSATVKDPVCGMDKGSDWTEYTVTGKDTSWFCSPHCKETFAKNPEKYLKQKTETKG